MRNWTWNQKPKIKVTMAVSKQCDSKLIFRWWDSHICHDTEVFGANSPEILHVSCLLCLQFSAFISVKPFLWHGNSDCLPVFLRKISFSCCSWTLCPFCLVERSFHPASLPFCGVFFLLCWRLGQGAASSLYSSAAGFSLPSGYSLLDWPLCWLSWHTIVLFVPVLSVRLPCLGFLTVGDTREVAACTLLSLGGSVWFQSSFWVP